MNTAEADDEADDPGALAAVGCLRAISTILESVSRLPHLFAHVEPTLLPIMRRMLTTDGQGNNNILLFIIIKKLQFTNFFLNRGFRRSFGNRILHDLFLTNNLHGYVESLAFTNGSSC